MPAPPTVVYEALTDPAALRVSGFDPANPPYPGWAGWLGGIAALRRYHELPDWRSIWRQVEIPGLPAGMLATEHTT